LLAILLLLHYTNLPVKISTNFFAEKYFTYFRKMDYSKYIEMKQKAANVYKSNWQARDASEVTMRNQAIGSANNKSTHQGPIDPCISCTLPNSLSSTNPPTKGYSTDYSINTVTSRISGCIQCNDPVWGKAGGVTLIGCDQVTTILTPPNPTTSNSVSCYAPSTSVPFRQVASESNGSRSYTGWRNHVPTTGKGNIPVQVYPYPS
jgi:hypothetical protein